MKAFGCAACAVLVASLWLPWATLSIGLFGGSPEGLGTVNGQDIGSSIVGLPVGWIMAAAGVVGLLAISSRSRDMAGAAGIVAVLVAGYTLLSMPGTETTTANGQDVSGLVNGQVGFAWGVFAVTAAALGLIVASRALSSAPAGNEIHAVATVDDEA
jgi:hypothetical protein